MIKAAESAMLESQRRLKLAKDSDEINAQVPRHAMEGFIQRQTKLAVGGILGPGDAAVLKQRLWESTACPPHTALHHRHRYRHRHRHRHHHHHQHHHHHHQEQQQQQQHQ